MSNIFNIFGIAKQEYDSLIWFALFMRKSQIARTLNRRRLDIDTTQKGRIDVQINHDPMIFAVWQYVVYRPIQRTSYYVI